MRDWYKVHKSMKLSSVYEIISEKKALVGLNENDCLKLLLIYTKTSVFIHTIANTKYFIVLLL